MIILLGCKSNQIEWEIKEMPYVITQLQKNNENTLVIRRIHNINTNEKYVEFKFYLSWDGVTNFVTKYNKFFPEIDKTKENLINMCKTNFNMKLDDYFYESLENLEIQKETKDRNDFSSDLVLITDEDPNMQLIITISNGKASYEVWNNDIVEIENGVKDNLNIESKIYN